MSSGERPIGAAKGKQSDTQALCQAPPLQGAQPMPGHSPPDGKCQLPWRLQPTVTAPNRSRSPSNRLPTRFWGHL